MGDKGVGGHHSDDAGDGEQSTAASWTGKALDFLKVLDLSPAYKEKSINSRSQLGGFLFLVYLPLLLAYLVYTIQPEFVPIPTCCACPIPGVTPDDSFVYAARNAACSANDACSANVSAALADICDRALKYKPPEYHNISLRMTSINCWGHKPGDACTQDCVDLSNQWLTNTDYRGPQNRLQADYQCGVGLGLCDFKVTFLNKDTATFPHGLCQFPSITNLLLRLGAATGLFNGIIITLRSNIRSLGNRIRTNSVVAPDGTMWDFFKGSVVAFVFPYIGFVVMLMANGIPHRMRYGAQIMMALMLLFASSPFSVYIIYVLRDLWGPMLILVAIRGIAKFTVIRTLYTMIRLELWNHHELLRSQARAMGLIKAEPTTSLAGDLFSDIKESLKRKELFLSGFVVTNSNGSIDDITAALPRELLDKGHYHWLDFFLGVAICPVVMLVPAWRRNHPGVKEGAWVGSVLWVLIICWVFLSVYGVWEDYLSLDFPLTIDDNAYNDQLLTTVQQSTYVVLTDILMIVLIYKLELFFQFLPKSTTQSPLKQNAFYTKYFAILETKKFGTKSHYRAGFMAGVIPVLVGGCVLFGFLYDFSHSELPESKENCTLPIWVFIVPLACLVPGFILFCTATTDRMRWGSMAALGTDLLLMGLSLWVMSFFFCYAYWYSQMACWVLECVGMALILYCALRPNVLINQKDGEKGGLNGHAAGKNKKDGKGKGKVGFKDDKANGLAEQEVIEEDEVFAHRKMGNVVNTTWQDIDKRQGNPGVHYDYESDGDGGRKSETARLI